MLNSHQSLKRKEFPYPFERCSECTLGVKMNTSFFLLLNSVVSKEEGEDIDADVGEKNGK